MQLAVTLQYFPDNADPITVHACTDRDLLREFRRAALAEAASRREAASPDRTGLLIELAEEDRLRRVFDLLVPEEMDQ
jgi:hypothetical protein